MNKYLPSRVTCRAFSSDNRLPGSPVGAFSLNQNGTFREATSRAMFLPLFKREFWPLFWGHLYKSVSRHSLSTPKRHPEIFRVQTVERHGLCLSLSLRSFRCSSRPCHLSFRSISFLSKRKREHVKRGSGSCILQFCICPTWVNSAVASP